MIFLLIEEIKLLISTIRMRIDLDMGIRLVAFFITIPVLALMKMKFAFVPLSAWLTKDPQLIPV